MDEVDLPIGADTTSLSEAGDLMAAHGRTAVVVQRNENWVVLTTEDMHTAVVASTKGGKPAQQITLAEVQPSRQLSQRARTELAFPDNNQFRGPRAVLDLHLRSSEVRGLSNAFAQEGLAQYIVLERTDTLARVATAHEPIANALRRTISRGICQDPRRHSWWPFELIVAGRCNHDDTKVDFS